jgi:hypothetical protein
VQTLAIEGYELNEELKADCNEIGVENIDINAI